jgi:gentisate 1,2-dioxygenase
MSAAGQIDPHDGILLEYAHPLNGGPTMPTIGCWVQLIPPGVTTKAQRHTSSTVYHVVQGEGVARVRKKKAVRDDLNWGAKDCFFVPSWNWYEFRNKSSKEPAIIFSVTDRRYWKAWDSSVRNEIRETIEHRFRRIYRGGAEGAE